VASAALAAAWAAVSAAVQAHSFLPPPPLDPGMWAELDQHGVARRRVAPTVEGGPETALGLDRWPVSKSEAWLSITEDSKVKAVKGLTEIVLRGRWGSNKLLYQHLDLPWPLQDRHWAIALQGNPALAKSSGVWERSWKLDLAAMELAAPRMGSVYQEALVTPVNEGGWLLVELAPRDTLVLYQARASFGGGVPDSAVEGWALSNMVELLQKFEQGALGMRSSYGHGCDQQPGGDGATIPCFTE